MTIHRCAECGQAGSYYASNRSTCKACVRKRSAARKALAPEAQREYQRRYRERLRLRAELKDALLFRLARRDLDRFGDQVRTLEDTFGMEAGTLESSLRQKFVSSGEVVKSDLVVVAEVVADLLISLSPAESGAVFRRLLDGRPGSVEV